MRATDLLLSGIVANSCRHLVELFKTNFNLESLANVLKDW